MSTKWRRTAAAAVGVALGALVAGCGPSGTVDGDRQYTIGVTTLFSSPIINGYTAGMQAEADKRGITLKVNTADSNVGKEASIIDTYITQQVDAILIDPISDSGSIPAVQRAVAAGITVLCYDTCIQEDAKASMIKGYVTSDQTALGREAGEAAAKYIAEDLGGKAKIGMLTCDQSYAICAQRRDGFLSALAPGSYEIVAKQEGYVVDKARPLATDMLTANPDLGLIFGQNEGSTIGAALAVKSAGRTGTHVVGIDITPVIAQLMTEPDPALVFTAGQGAEELGQKAIGLAVDALEGRPQAETQYAGLLPYSASDQAGLAAYLSTHN
ncbi:substrate-binding domain-containing protein [Pseudonocardia yuanmonensis]|uniref:Substrate-binding domain-containing protein n=1 Tax=Pseudonocardia yuanmonensis TaxID=1095914 RepID=A0ABP8WJD2_9PSEU